jgi:hypothetical protein
MSQAPAVAVCPFAHEMPAIRRSRGDEVVRKVLRVRDHPRGLTDRSAVHAFRRSMLISTVRCTLTYLVFPFVLPALGLVAGTGVVLGMVIGALAITCDIFTIRRFFAVDHKWRWHFSAVAFSVVCLLAVLLAQDVAHIVS